MNTAYPRDTNSSSPCVTPGHPGAMMHRGTPTITIDRVDVAGGVRWSSGVGRLSLPVAVDQSALLSAREQL